MKICSIRTNKLRYPYNKTLYSRISSTLSTITKTRNLRTTIDVIIIIIIMDSIIIDIIIIIVIIITIIIIEIIIIIIIISNNRISKMNKNRKSKAGIRKIYRNLRKIKPTFITLKRKWK